MYYSKTVKNLALADMIKSANDNIMTRPH